MLYYYIWLFVKSITLPEFIIIPSSIGNRSSSSLKLTYNLWLHYNQFLIFQENFLISLVNNFKSKISSSLGSKTLPYKLYIIALPLFKGKNKFAFYN